MKTFLLVAALAAPLAAGIAAETPTFAPCPRIRERGDGEFIFGPDARFQASAGTRAGVEGLLDEIAGRIGARPEVGPMDPARPAAVRAALFGDIDAGPEVRELRPSPARPESFALRITREGVLLGAEDLPGLRHGAAALARLLPPRPAAGEPGPVPGSLRLPCLRIGDWPEVPWRGIHVFPPSEAKAGEFRRFVDEFLVPLRFNAIVLEVDYDFPYESHPEARSPDVRSKTFYVDLAAFLKSRGIRPIPQFNFLGHQSWAKHTLPLLARHPEFDETPALPPDNPGIYCRSWCPRSGAGRFAGDLVAELVEAFRPDAVHVGMDEVFILADPQCPRCAGAPPAALFAGAVTEIHDRLAGRGVGLLLWGDRLLEKSRFPYSEWEASANGTAGALGRIPLDAIACDWHYGKQAEYPSIPHFQQRGLRVLACGWKEPEAARAFYRYALAHREGGLLGFLATTWISCDAVVAAALEGRGDRTALGVIESVKIAGEMGWSGDARREAPPERRRLMTGDRHRSARR